MAISSLQKVSSDLPFPGQMSSKLMKHHPLYYHLLILIANVKFYSVLCVYKFCNNWPKNKHINGETFALRKGIWEKNLTVKENQILFFSLELDYYIYLKEHLTLKFCTSKLNRRLTTDFLIDWWYQNIS